MRLLEAALRIFAEVGYDGARTRDLAEAAEVNQQLVAYYFGGKGGLHEAVARHVVELLGPRLGTLSERARSATSTAASDEIRRSAFRDFVRGVALAMIRTDEDRRPAQFIIREQIRPGPAAAILFDGLIGPLQTTGAELLAAATGRGRDDPAVIIETHAILGQVLAFVVARDVALRRLGWDRLSPERVASIADAIADLSARACDQVPSHAHPPRIRTKGTRP